MHYHWSGTKSVRFEQVRFLGWDWAAKCRSGSEQRAWAAQQNTASLLLCSQEHQQACEDRDKAGVMLAGAWVRGCTFILHVSVSMCVCQWVMLKTVCVCVLYPLPREPGLLSKLDSVIGSSENPNEAMSIWAAAPLPEVPAQPTGRPQPRLLWPDVRRGGPGSGGQKIWVNFRTVSAPAKVTAANPAVKYDLIISDGGR